MVGTTQHDLRLAALRESLASQQLDGWFVGREDMFQGEEVQAGDERLAFLCGFTGSAGFGLVLKDRAALFSDGRYTLQMVNQTNQANWTTYTMPEETLAGWLKGMLVADLKIGVDKNLVTLATFDRLARTFGDADVTLIGTDMNLIDSIWQDQPSPPVPAPFRLDVATAGATMAEKLQQLDAALQDADCTAIFLSRVDSVNWLTNIRGRDLACTPVMHAYALYHRENGLILLAEPGRLAAVMADDLASETSVVPLADFGALLDPDAGYGSGTKVMIEAASLPKSIFDILDESTVELVRRPCPVMHAKALKNEAEQKGTRRAHIEDGASMARFLAWLETLTPGQLQETEIAAHLLSIRRENPNFISSSFETICGSGPNGAIVHYRAIEGADSALVGDSLLLVDSGAHYSSGTTDITRTMAIGTPSEQMRHAFTCVLKGHIAVARARFPADSTGQQIDVLARGPLWAEGLDYAHGTGHGVGHIMQVHEGPASLSKRGTERLVAGMLLSNEPGYYREGEWGIRIENLIIVNPPDDAGFLSFETITHCPIDKRLINAGMLTDAERAWLNAYHSKVGALVSPLLDGDEAVREWLRRACAPL